MTEQLERYWNIWFRRIDGLSLRERALLFLSFVVVLAGVVNVLFLAPLQASRAQLQAQRERMATDLSALQAQYQALVNARGATGGAGVLQSQLSQMQERHAQQKAQREHGLQQLPQAWGLSAALQALLRRHETLSLVRLRTLDELPNTAPPSPPEGFRWQAVEFAVSGRYAGLARYLASLEAEHPGLHWGEMSVQRTQPDDPVLLMSVQVFLLQESS
jgi:MSHA biogenesis protein MshJ